MTFSGIHLIEDNSLIKQRGMLIDPLKLCLRFDSQNACDIDNETCDGKWH